jgi:eukaryotic-like serine/threonine-protein kinase
MHEDEARRRLDASTLAARPKARTRAETPATTPAAQAAPATLPPSAARSASGTQAGITTQAHQTDATIWQALVSDELTRAHGFSGLIGFISVLVLAALPLLDGHPLSKLACAVALAVIAGVSLWVYRATREDNRYARRVLRIYGFTLATCVLLVENYIGFFSPVAVIVTLGVYYFAQSADRVQAWLIPALVMGSYLVMSALVTARIWPDYGLLDASRASLSSHVFAMLAVTLVLLLTMHMARVARASMRTAMRQSTEALMVARQREVLLAEAQQHLERALGVAVGKAGHYTGHLAGKFKLDMIIGIGAMGEIYAAEHVDSGEKAAVKLLRPTALRRSDLVERFLREGSICTQLSSPHLVTVHGAGTLEDGAPYLAMELLQGQDLAARLRKEGRLPLAEVLELAEALAEGLSHVHAAGVVHRDLKPVNVFLAEAATGSVRWKILDFGISKPRESTGTLTDVGVVGTPGYMSPEQARGLPVDQRSDIFSMAVLLYRALTGRPAFTGNDAPQIMFDVVYRMPERPSTVAQGLPSDIDLVFAIALAKAPGERFASVRELAEALRQASQRNLAPELRKRAAAILRACPWGEPITPVGAA